MNQVIQFFIKLFFNFDILNVIKKNKGKFFKIILDLNVMDYNYFYDKNFDGNWVKVVDEKWNFDVKI